MSIQGSVNQLLNISAIGLGAVQKQQYGQLQSELGATLKGVKNLKDLTEGFESQGEQGDMLKQSFKSASDYLTSGATDLEGAVDTSEHASINELRKIRKVVDAYDTSVMEAQDKVLKLQEGYGRYAQKDALLRAQKEVYGRNETAERMEDRIKEVKSMYNNILKEDTE